MAFRPIERHKLELRVRGSDGFPDDVNNLWTAFVNGRFELDTNTASGIPISFIQQAWEEYLKMEKNEVVCNEYFGSEAKVNRRKSDCGFLLKASIEGANVEYKKTQKGNIKALKAKETQITKYGNLNENTQNALVDRMISYGERARAAERETAEVRRKNELLIVSSRETQRQLLSRRNQRASDRVGRGNTCFNLYKTGDLQVDISPEWLVNWCRDGAGSIGTDVSTDRVLNDIHIKAPQDQIFTVDNKYSTEVGYAKMTPEYMEYVNSKRAEGVVFCNPPGEPTPIRAAICEHAMMDYVRGTATAVFILVPMGNSSLCVGLQQWATAYWTLNKVRFERVEGDTVVSHQHGVHVPFMLAFMGSRSVLQRLLNQQPSGGKDTCSSITRGYAEGGGEGTMNELRDVLRRRMTGRPEDWSVAVQKDILHTLRKGAGAWKREQMAEVQEKERRLVQAELRKCNEHQAQQHARPAAGQVKPSYSNCEKRHSRFQI